MTLMASGHSFSEAAERPESVAPVTTAKPPARYRRYLRRASGRFALPSCTIAGDTTRREGNKKQSTRFDLARVLGATPR
jgi:hypothetical protein